MSLLAQFEQATEAGERRASPRRRLRLEIEGSGALSPESRVLVHDLSRTGLLIETSDSLPLGTRFEVQIPEAGSVEAEVVWNSSRFLGCRFDTPISNAALSAALLRSSAPDVEQESAPSDAEALIELKELGERVRQACAVIDRIVDRLDEAEPATKPDRHSANARIPGGQDAAERQSHATILRVVIVLAVAAWAVLIWALGLL